MGDLLIESGFLLVIFIGISYLSSYLWRKSLPIKLYTFLVFPGVIIHEVSHIIACIFTGAKIKKVKLFSKKGGYVKHKKPKLPLIGVPLISLFPLVGGILFLQLTFYLFDFNLVTFSLNLSFFGSLEDIFIANWKSWSFWLVIYLSVSIIINVIPSKKDFRNSLSSLFVIFFITSLLIYFNLFNEYLSEGLKVFKNLIEGGIAFGAISLVLAIVIGLITYVISILFN